MSNPTDTKTMRSLVEAANSIDEAAKRTVTQYYYWETLRGNQTPTQSIYHVQVAGKPLGYGSEATGVELVVDSDGGWHISKMGRILLSGHGKPYPSAEAALAILKGGQGAWNPNDPKMRVNRLKESAEDISEARDFNDPNRIKDDLTPDQRMLQSNALTLLYGVIDAASKRTVELQRFSREAQGILTTVRTNPSNPLDDITAEALHNLLSTGVELGIVKKNVPDLFTGMAKGKVKPKRMR